MKFFLDTETTGLDYRTYGVHEFAGILVDNDLTYIDHIHLKFRPSDDSVIDDDALAISRTDRDEVLSRDLNSKDACGLVVGFLRKHYPNHKYQFISYHTAFDSPFVESWMVDCGYDYHKMFYRPPICVYQQCAWLLQDKRADVPYLKLMEMCEYAGVEYDVAKAHSALYDTKKLFELYKEVR